MSVSLRSPARSRRTVLRIDTLEDRTVPATVVGTNFAGINGTSSPYFPPDTNGCVGPNHYVEIVNGEYRVFSKTGTVLQSKDDDAFWRAAGLPTSIVGGVNNGQVSDPRVIYDPLSDRWFASEISVESDPGNSVLIARSDTNDPTGTWKGLSYLCVANGSAFGDYDTLGVDANGVFIGTLDFGPTSIVSCTLTSIPKADLLLPTPTIANKTQVTQSSLAMGDHPQGANNRAPVIDHSTSMSVDIAAFSQINFTKITGVGGSGASFGATTNIAVQSTSLPQGVIQPDGTSSIDPIDDRIGGRVWQVGDLVIGAHAIRLGGRNAIRVTVLSDSASSVVAEGTLTSAVYDYIDPSVAMNSEGDILIGCTRSGGTGSTNGNLSAYAVPAYLDPNNLAGGITIDTAQEKLLKLGAIPNYHAAGGRWGDYSATDVDPTNPTAFWTVQEYVINNGTWGTQISQVFFSPRVTSAGVTSTAADGIYTTGQVIPITVTFNDAVNVTGFPALALNSGGSAVYASGSGSKVLTFNYTVGGGQATTDLDYTAAAVITLPGGATIKDAVVASSLPAILILPAQGAAGSLGASKNIQIDTTPRITGVSSPLADGTYGTGNVIPITVTFGSAVTVAGGAPVLALNSAGSAVATYASGSGTATLTFNYTVASGEATNDLDYANADALTLPGGVTMKDTGNPTVDAVLTLPDSGTPGSLGANKNIKIDTNNPSVVDVTTAVANGTYGFAAVIPITMTFTKKVTVTGTPQLALNTGVTLNYASGSGTTTLTFSYTVALNNFTLDLDYASTAALTLPGAATIKEFGTATDAVLTLPATGGPGSLGGNKDIAIDAFPAKAVDVSSGLANGLYIYNSNITIAVTFDKAVTVTGFPTLALNSGGVATYTGGTGTKILSFAFTVGLTDFSPDLDYTLTGIALPGGATIKDQANSSAAAGLTLPAPGTPGSLGANKNIIIDGLPGKPADVTAGSSNGTYGIGAVIPITVTFTKPVDVTGSPQLALNSGGTATYTGGAGTFTTLTFSYTVLVGHNTSDLDAASAGALTGGTIKDNASGTAAPLGLPILAATGSLATNKNIVIDTFGPMVLEYRVKFGTKWYNLIGSTRFDVPWKVTAIQVVFDEAVSAGNKASLTGDLASSKLTGLGTNILTWKIPTKMKGSFNTALANSGANALKDAGGNPIAPFAKSFNVLYGDFNDDQVVNAQDEAGVRANLAKPYQLGTTNYNIFADLSGDGIANLIDIGISRTRKGNTLP